MNSMMLVGAASTELRFAPGLPMAGFAARVALSTGTHDRLSAQAITVGTNETATLLVVADLTSISPEQAGMVRRRIAEATGIHDHAITVAVTHTHAAPNIDPWMTTPTAPSRVWNAVCDSMVAVAVAAWERRTPSSLMTAVGAASLTINRRRPDGPRDESLHVLRFVTPNGRTSAVVFSYACHPTVIGSDNTLLSADWPGAARARVEEAYPDAAVLYLQGFSGDCNTGHTAHSSMDVNAQHARTPERAVTLGRRLGNDVIELASRATTSVGPVRQSALIHEWAWGPEDAVAPVFPPVSESVAQETMMRLTAVWSERMRTLASTREVLRVSCFQWADVLLVQASGEPFSELGLDLRRLLPSTHVLPVGYANGVPGYLPYPAAERARGGYEVNEAHVVYGRAQPLPDLFATEGRDFAVAFANA